MSKTLVLSLLLFTSLSARSADKPILSSKPFHGETKKAYELAAENSEVLKSIKCHCGCMEDMGHTSLKSCFEGKHGQKCPMCRREVIRVSELKAQGKTTQEISEQIDREFEEE